MGYHKKEIEKGVLGEFSKVREEFEELSDAHEQDNKILVMCELCDLLGAIEEYAKSFNLTLKDLNKMKEATKSAFLEGKRS
jgi:phosphoribosyl-ATP pyrophosphohydrolase